MKGARLLPLIALLWFTLPVRAATVPVVWDSDGFTPDSVTIASGDTVEWINNDSFFSVQITSDAPFGDPDYFSIFVFDGDYEDVVFTYAGPPGSTHSIPYHSNWGDTGTVVIQVPAAETSIVLAEPRQAGGSFLFDATGLTDGKTNVLLASSNLFTWTPLQTNVAAGSSMTFTNSLSARTGFYRLVELP